MHRREVAKTTATGRLALLALPNSALLVHGHEESRLDLRAAAGAERRILVLFPGEGGTPLSRAFVDADPRPITLVVPDGSWRQASKAARRIPGLADAVRVTLPEGPPTEYRLRREPKADGLATFEAIARALGILEAAEVEVRLRALFTLMVERTLGTRGVPRSREPERAR